MIRWLLLMYLGIACQGVTDIHSRNLTNSMKIIYEWKYIDYDFGSDEKRQAAIQSGDYNYTMNYLLDTDQWGDKTFVIIMKFNGVPSSLNVITNKTGNGGPLLAPYPDWTWAKNENCSGITSAYKIEIDMCDRLWVLDSGLINNVRSVCPPQLLVFDLNTSQLLKQVKIPHDIAVNTTTEKGALVTLSVQLLSCEVNGSTLVYIGDNEGFALIIYNNSDNSFQRLTSSTFASDPRYTTFTINGESFTLQSGIFGMALSPLTQNLYYSALSSHNLNYVNTEQFVKSQYQANNVHYQGKENILWTQASAKGISDNGVLFFGLVGDTSLACWNENRLLDRRNIEVVAKNKETLQAITGLKVKRRISFILVHGFPLEYEYVLAVSNRIQKVIYGFDFNDVNFRILIANVNDLIKNTRCISP